MAGWPTIPTLGHLLCDGGGDGLVATAMRRADVRMGMRYIVGVMGPAKARKKDVDNARVWVN